MISAHFCTKIVHPMVQPGPCPFRAKTPPLYSVDLIPEKVHRSNRRTLSELTATSVPQDDQGPLTPREQIILSKVNKVAESALDEGRIPAQTTLWYEFRVLSSSRYARSYCSPILVDTSCQITGSRARLFPQINTVVPSYMFLFSLS